MNKGVYPRIPKTYSKDLAYLIKMLLQVNPNSRPGCEDLLNLPMIIQKAKKLCPDIYLHIIRKQPMNQTTDMLLKTIYVPKYHPGGGSNNKTP